MQLHLLWKIINVNYKIPYNVHGCSPHGAINVRMYDFHRLCCSPPPLFGNATLCCLSSMYALQNNEDVRQENLPMFISLTIFWRVRTPFTFNWLRERCQSSSVSSSVGDCTKLVAFASYIFTKSILYKLRSHGAIAWLHYCNIWQYICLGWIGPLNYLTQVAH